jgi:oligopeptide transport system ATP-binding protein
LLTVQHLKTHFHTREGIVRAVDGVSFDVEPNEMLAIVGESGCGKSVTAYSLLGLIPMPPGRIEGGEAHFDGTELLHASRDTLRRIRGRHIAMIFQDPMTALNPYLRIGDQVMEPLLVHSICDKTEARRRAVEALEAVGIPEAAARMRSYPHEFSGGMRQRVMIAMALVTRPQLVIADEPTTALDVTVQAQILDLLTRLRDEYGLAVVLITHDMGVVAGHCERLLVMYAGKVVESGPTEEVFAAPRHPYTQALLDALPSAGIKGQPLNALPGLPPNLSQEIIGCPFAPRCPHAVAYCRVQEPQLEEVAAQRHSACLRVQRGEL